MSLTTYGSSCFIRYRGIKAPVLIQLDRRWLGDPLVFQYVGVQLVIRCMFLSAVVLLVPGCIALCVRLHLY
jgi:hypothetical protein